MYSLHYLSFFSLQPEKVSGTLKEQLDAITPALREMRLRKEVRVNQFRAVQGQIQKISAEIAGHSRYDDSLTNIILTENDLSLKKLEEYQSELQRLHKDKIISKRKVIQHEFLNLQLYHLGQALTNLRNLMDTADNSFTSLTCVRKSSSEVSDPRSLALNIIQEDENWYSVSRRAHRNLRCAEKARILVNKIPGTFDGKAMIEEYNIVRLEKEDEKRRQKETKKVQIQVVEPQPPFSSRQSTSSRPPSDRSLNGCLSYAAPSNRKAVYEHPTFG
ncbi:unnamed protein product [Linum tenue]|uniref:Uncharacterized protein n=1 Tax=Linum tenue TaxID=586396 RepID=A0AAV0S2T2_9ROSI|nr:unnamed protein product [Linum tenue]